MGENRISAYQRKGAEHWYFSYYIDGKRIQRATTLEVKKYSLTDAALYADRYVKLKLNARVTTTFRQHGETMFTPGSDYLAYRAARGVPVGPAYRDQMIQALRNHFFPKFGDKVIGTVKLFEIENFLIRLKLSNAMKNVIIAGIRRMFDEAARMEIIEISPRITYFASNGTPRKIFTPAMYARMFTNDMVEMARVWKRVEHMLFSLILSATGVRFGECHALNTDDFSVEGTLYITKSRGRFGIGTTKNGEWRVVLIPKTLSDTVLAFVKKRDGSLHGQYIFPKGFTPYREGFVHAMKELGIVGYVPHCFRHTYNTMLSQLVIENKMTKEVQMLLLGHKSIKVSRHYDHHELGSLAQRLIGYSSAIPVDGLLSENDG